MTIDLFSLYVLFSHFRPRDATRRNSFFQMSSYAGANVRITNEKKMGNSHEGITWSEMGKKNVQAKNAYWKTNNMRSERKENCLSLLQHWKGQLFILSLDPP